jgi:hypothetical protein
MDDTCLGSLRAGQSGWALRMMSKLFSFRHMILFAFMLFFLPGNPCAISAPLQNPAIPLPWNLFSNLSHMQSLGSSPGMLGEAPAFADFDDDQKQDIAIARLSNNRYKIVVLLSTRSQAAILNPSVHLTGFTIHAYDINNDSSQDIVVTDTTAMHPLAVWLGDGRGSFEIADQNLFENGFTFTESPKHQNNLLPPDQDVLDESLDPTCGKIAPTFEDPRLEQKGLVTCGTHSCALRNVTITTAPRSPPMNNPT